MSLVELARFYRPVEADVVRLLLESHGLPAYLFDVGLNNVMGGGPQSAVRLMVLDEDYDDAVAIVSKADST